MKRTASIETIAIRKSERGLAVGGTGSGKSTLCEVLLDTYLDLYPAAHVLLLDTKPRFRAEWELTGMSAAHRYKRWDHGKALSNSYVLDFNRGGDYGLNDVWKLGGRIAVAQTARLSEIPLVMEAAEQFFQQARASRPQLLYADEIKDFYGMNGQPVRGIGEDGILRGFRAGRELGMSVLVSSQVPKGIPLSMKSELSKIYLFRLDNEEDVDNLQGYGLPRDAQIPVVDHLFYFYNKVKRAGGLARLTF